MSCRMVPSGNVIALRNAIEEVRVRAKERTQFTVLHEDGRAYIGWERYVIRYSDAVLDDFPKAKLNARDSNRL